MRCAELLVGRRPSKAFFDGPQYLLEQSKTQHLLPAEAALRGALCFDQSPWVCRVSHEGDPESVAELQRCGRPAIFQSEPLEPGKGLQYPATISVAGMSCTQGVFTRDQ